MITSRAGVLAAGRLPKAVTLRIPRRSVVLRRIAVVALGGSVLAVALEAAYVRSLGRRIAPAFLAGDLWTHPSRIYSKPQPLRAGMALDRARLVSRLGRLGYTETEGVPQRVGEYRATPAAVDVYLRGFEFPSGTAPSGRVRVAFRRNGTIGSVTDPLTGKPIDNGMLEGEVLATLTGDVAEDRTVSSLREFPESLVQAVIAAEDRRFRRHFGIDPIGIARAAIANLAGGEIVQGASTITQQTVKNVLLGTDRTWSRKFREAQLALALETQLSKEEILEIYLNEVYLGQRNGVAICGFGEAARFYFGKDVRDLELAEAALLAGMIPAPAKTNPFRNLERAVARRNTVLRTMLAQGQVSEEACRNAVDAVPSLASESARAHVAPAFVQFVRKQLREAYAESRILREGLRVHTTLDSDMQIAAEAALRRGLEALERKRPRLKRRNGEPLEAALVVLDPTSGEILALVGGRDFSRNQFDHALLAKRQLGSLIKPLVYLAGFERAAQDPLFPFTSATLLDDAPVEIPAGDNTIWIPQDYDDEMRGLVTVREALEDSINIPAVRASQEIGLPAIAMVARGCGIRTPADVVPSLALGSNQAAPIELARAYATIAAGGLTVEPFAVAAVVSRDGEVLERSNVQARPVVSPVSAYLALDLMRGVLRRGTAAAASGAGIRGDFAGKTGTTNDTRDAWFIGFSPEILAAVWVGFDDNAPTGLTGASGALPIWIDFIRSVGAATPEATFLEPEGITHVRIDPTTGGIAGQGCIEVIEEIFRTGSEPLDVCPAHGTDEERLTALAQRAALEANVTLE